MNTMLVVLPIETQTYEACLEHPVLGLAFENYPGGLKALADLVFLQRNSYYEPDDLIASVCDDIFAYLDAYDENPVIEKYNQDVIRKAILSDYFMCFLQTFCVEQRKVFDVALAQIDYHKAKPVQCRSRSSNAYLLYL